jgi:hypothetical protein
MKLALRHRGKHFDALPSNAHTKVEILGLMAGSPTGDGSLPFIGKGVPTKAQKLRS